MKHQTQNQAPDAQAEALRQEAWRHMHAPMAEQQRWYAGILRGHYGLLWAAEQLVYLGAFPSGGSTHLVPLPAAE